MSDRARNLIVSACSLVVTATTLIIVLFFNPIYGTRLATAYVCGYEDGLLRGRGDPRRVVDEVCWQYVEVAVREGVPASWVGDLRGRTQR